MTNQQMAKKKILTGAFLQSVIRQETGIETERQQYNYNDAGRPFLANATGRIDFNLSDSGQYAVLAVSDERVGWLQNVSSAKRNMTESCLLKRRNSKTGCSFDTGR